MQEIILQDLYRYYERKETFKESLLRPLEVKYIVTLRKVQLTKNKLLRLFYRLKLRRLSSKTLIQIPAAAKIGAGFYIGHRGCIIINRQAELGRNVNIATGVTIGQTNRGKNKGVPQIGNQVWIGTNSVIVGKIIIGDDVLIAPNTYVNFDVPSHSIVVGNPGVIIHRDYATEGYIEKTV